MLGCLDPLIVFTREKMASPGPNLKTWRDKDINEYSAIDDHNLQREQILISGYRIPSNYVKEIRIHLRLTATYVHDVYVKKE
jgi:hypothetical protein